MRSGAHHHRSTGELSATYLFALVLLIVVIVFATLASGAPATTSPATRPTTSSVSAIEREPVRKNIPSEQRAAPTTSTSGVVARGAGAPPSFDARRVGLSLAIVIGLIFLARFTIKRLFPAASVGRSTQVIKVLSRSVIAPKQQFLLLQVGKRLIVVGDSGSNMSALAEIADAQEVASIIGQLSSETSSSSTAAFGAMFRKQRSAFEQDQKDAPPPPELADVPPPAGSDDDEKLVAASSEISGLLERVKLVSRRLQRP
jgi:flagellar biogenesis protein FliO